MSDLVEVPCEKCEKTALITTAALHSDFRIKQQLPMGWLAVRKGKDARRRDVFGLYCPNHKHEASKSGEETS